MLEIFPVYITPFNQERLIRVYLPKNYYEEVKKYPVLYMHDGQNVFQDQDAIGGISLGFENYLVENDIEVIVVGIDQNSEERINEYCPWVNGEFSKKILGYSSISGGKGKQYVHYIVNDLKSLIDHKYRTIQDNTAMAGISLGGLITTYAACCYPHIFNKIAVFSSAFWRNQEEIEMLIRTSNLSAIERFYLDCGTKEGKGEFINKEFLASNTEVYKLLKQKIKKTEFNVIHDAEHQYLFFKTRISKIFPNE